MKGNGLVVLNNVLNGKFIVTMEKAKFHSELTNPRVLNDIEKTILIEFNNAKFVKISIGSEKAETQKFYFYRYDEDSEEEIIWVETKGEDILTQ